VELINLLAKRARRGGVLLFFRESLVRAGLAAKAESPREVRVVGRVKSEASSAVVEMAAL
jgi:hypothetical protein